MKAHYYNTIINWTRNKGKGTETYKAYTRDHTIEVKGKPTIEGSSDPDFLGDATRYNPEELLLASLSSCHMLWYLHLCAEAGIIVTAYTDNAEGTMTETPDGSGHFTSVTLNPVVTVKETPMMEKANELHNKANKRCFIANSCNFPVYHKPLCKKDI
ncbi:OsmC family protein [Flavobacterium sp. AG291]|uniref:OsmC family protein n=1 Tax=Flavobacterium sp. AG291 TaxID=2184000 RepID=UPI000E0B5286|nr:OsmC family protein [Flavobacterium sp. AG291]RDI08545.1 organic hydroperoxide reductase OsmC/OhrA [Flavobacterium sp. AG291]